MSMNLYAKLSKIQQEMKAPKSKYNSFGKYKYRSLEDILEAFKPFEEKYSVFLVLEDSIECIGDRFYLKATATLYDCESNVCINTSALARESAEKKGMDDSQITGTASSYARKYCLNALFLLDDTKDADTDEYKNQSDRNGQYDAKATEEAKETAKLQSRIMAYVTRCSNAKEMNNNICGKFGVKAITEMSAEQCAEFINIMGQKGKEI